MNTGEPPEMEDEDEDYNDNLMEVQPDVVIHDEDGQEEDDADLEDHETAGAAEANIKSEEGVDPIATN